NEKRRRFVRTLSDADADVSEPAPGEPDAPPAPATPPSAEAWGDPSGTLARIAIRKVSQPMPREDGALELGNVDDAARAIRRAASAARGRARGDRRPPGVPALRARPVPHRPRGSRPRPRRSRFDRVRSPLAAGAALNKRTSGFGLKTSARVTADMEISR